MKGGRHESVWIYLCSVITWRWIDHWFNSKQLTLQTYSVQQPEHYLRILKYSEEPQDVIVNWFEEIPAISGFKHEQVWKNDVSVQCLVSQVSLSNTTKASTQIHPCWWRIFEDYAPQSLLLLLFFPWNLNSCKDWCQEAPFTGLMLACCWKIVIFWI